MKACDELWAKAIEKEPRYIPSIPSHSVYEMGFRDALEWVKSRSDCGKDLYMIATEDIDRELED